MADDTITPVQLAVRNRSDQPFHEIGYVDDGAFIVFAQVRDGRVDKQTQLAADAKAQALLHPPAQPATDATAV